MAWNKDNVPEWSDLYLQTVVSVS